MAAAKGIWTAFTLTVRAFTGPWTRSNGAGWVALILFILVLRWAFFELYSIPSGSMLPTLNGDPRYFRGDRVAVNKFLFGPRIPFTTNRIVPFWEPKRWDIVVFNNVDPDAEHAILIKRVVGLPGERIHISGGRIHVNGEAVALPPEPTPGHGSEPAPENPQAPDPPPGPSSSPATTPTDGDEDLLGEDLSGDIE